MHGGAAVTATGTTERHIGRHVHFGLGSLTLGLVLPLFDSASHTVIFQRRSNKWIEFKDIPKLLLEKLSRV